MLNLGCQAQGKGPGMSQRGGVQGGPSELLGTPRRFLGARGLLPRNSSELLGGSSEVPRRKPQACAGWPPAGRRGRANLQKSCKSIGKYRFSWKVMKNMVLLAFFTNVWHILAEPAKTDRRHRPLLVVCWVNFEDMLVMCWWWLVQFRWCLGDVAIICKYMTIHLLLFVGPAISTATIIHVIPIIYYCCYCCNCGFACSVCYYCCFLLQVYYVYCYLWQILLVEPHHSNFHQGSVFMPTLTVLGVPFPCSFPFLFGFLLDVLLVGDHLQP